MPRTLNVASRVRRPRRLAVTTSRELAVVYGVVLVLFLFGAIWTSSFLDSQNILALFGTAAPLALVALGETAVVIGGGIDLSVGSTMSMVAVLGAKIMDGHDDRLAVAVVACLGAGAAIGLVNGLLVTIGRVQPIVATLATLSVVQGISIWMAPEPTGAAAPALLKVTYERVGPIPIAVFVMVGAVLLAYAGLRWTRFGLRLYATGGYRAGALRSGVRVQRSILCSYIWCGVFAAAAGLVLLSRLGVGDANSGAPFLLTAVGAVAIGGVDLFGGRGSVWGTLGGILALSLVTNVLNLHGVGSYETQLALGIGIIVVVGIYSARHYGRSQTRAIATAVQSARSRLRARQGTEA